MMLMIILLAKGYDVVCRVFLLKNAMNTSLPGLSIYNWDEGGQQKVIALVEGDKVRMEPSSSRSRRISLAG